MQGNLDALPLLELITYLGYNESSGSLSLQSNSQTVHISLEQGSIRSVSTNDPALRIGQVLIQLDLITEEQIEQALALQSIAADPERIGEVLVDVGYISESDINRTMATQIASAVGIMFNDPDREYAFQPVSGPADQNSSIDFTHESLVRVALFLAEYCLDQAGIPVPELPPERPFDDDELEEPETAQHEIVQRLTAVYQSATGANLHDFHPIPRMRRQVGELLQLILNPVSPFYITPVDRESEGLLPVPAYQVRLIDREIDVWTLTDLTRSARQLLLDLLNGEDRLHVLLSNLKPSTGNPDRAVRELSSARLIDIEIDHREETSDDVSRSDGDSPNDDRTVFLRLLR